jgi:hypothetical protein
VGSRVAYGVDPDEVGALAAGPAGQGFPIPY